MQTQNQIVETEHLFKALLEQPNGLARRILSKAGSNATDLLDKTDAYIRSQPRVSGESAQVLSSWQFHSQRDEISHRASCACSLRIERVTTVSGKAAQALSSCHVLSQKGRSARLHPVHAALGVKHTAMVLQVLGRNLEGTITKAEDIKKEWKDDFTSVEHLVLAMLDDARFGRKLLRDAGLDAGKLTQAIKDIRGGNRVQDQVPAPSQSLGLHIMLCQESLSIVL